MKKTHGRHGPTDNESACDENPQGLARRAKGSSQAGTAARCADCLYARRKRSCASACEISWTPPQRVAPLCAESIIAPIATFNSGRSVGHAETILASSEHVSPIFSEAM